MYIYIYTYIYIHTYIYIYIYDFEISPLHCDLKTHTENYYNGGLRVSPGVRRPGIFVSWGVSNMVAFMNNISKPQEAIRMSNRNITN